jgi:hypothetical protein
MAYDKLFLVGAADVRIYEDAQKSSLVAVGKSMVNTSITTSVSENEIRGGRTNALQYAFKHSQNAEVTITNTQWSPVLLSKTLGATLTMGFDIRKEESLTVSTGTVTVTNTPVGSEGGSARGWYTYDGVSYSGIFSGKVLTVDGAVPNASVICVSYYYTDSSVTTLTVPANFIPKIVYVEMEANLATSEAGAGGIVGTAIITIPALQLDGAVTLNMTSDGYSETPLSGKALAYTPVSGQGNACATSDVYFYISQYIFNSNWYDGLTNIAIVGGESELEIDDAIQLSVWGFNQYGSFQVPDYTDITFESSSEAVATVSATGVVTALTAGTTIITATVTDAPTNIDTTTITVNPA